ncbi:hypothetical protein ACMAZE_09200 [Pseudopelagicola sp. nBUS_20]|uniref:hypothetical protein n=1 Tax=Pseudopelagicola sp. nBUS_20 TaxID=3395317 RepID=UPI003EC10150
MSESKTKNTFVARIWLEDTASSTSTWRGHLRHVHGDEECYFQDFPTMLRFLERISGVSVPTLTLTPGNRGSETNGG